MLFNLPSSLNYPIFSVKKLIRGFSVLPTLQQVNQANLNIGNSAGLF